MHEIVYRLLWMRSECNQNSQQAQSCLVNTEYTCQMHSSSETFNTGSTSILPHPLVLHYQDKLHRNKMLLFFKACYGVSGTCTCITVHTCTQKNMLSLIIQSMYMILTLSLPPRNWSPQKPILPPVGCHFGHVF